MKVTLCTPSEIEDPGSKGFEFKQGDQTLDLFVVHRFGQFYGFINSCPHTGVNLEWLEDQFLDLDKCFIQCSTHDALFEIETGLCVAGPCVGDSLTAVPIELDQGNLVAELP